MIQLNYLTVPGADLFFVENGPTEGFLLFARAFFTVLYCTVLYVLSRGFLARNQLSQFLSIDYVAKKTFSKKDDVTNKKDGQTDRQAGRERRQAKTNKASMA